MTTVYNRFTELRPSLPVAFTPGERRSEDDASAVPRRRTNRSVCSGWRAFCCVRGLLVVVALAVLSCYFVALPLPASVLSTAYTGAGTGVVTQPGLKMHASFCRAWGGPVDLFGSPMVLWAPSAPIAQDSPTTDGSNQVPPFEVLVEATASCGGDGATDIAAGDACEGYGTTPFPTPATVLMRFDNASTFLELLRQDDDAGLVPNPAFGVTALFVGARKRLRQPSLLGSGQQGTNEIYHATQVERNGKRGGSQLSMEERTCLGIALETPCSVGFRVLPSSTVADGPVAGMSSWCVVAHPVVNKDMNMHRTADLFAQPGGALHIFMHAAELRGVPWRSIVTITTPAIDSVLLIDPRSGRTIDPLLVGITVGCQGTWRLTLSATCDERRLDDDVRERYLNVTSPLHNVSIDASSISFHRCRVVKLLVRAIPDGWGEDVQCPPALCAAVVVYPYYEGTVGSLDFDGGGGAPVVNRRCAALLAPSELCISNLVFRVRLGADAAHHMAPGPWNVSVPRALSRKLVTLVPDDAQHANAERPCIALVDGHVSYMDDATGAASFPSLVVRVDTSTPRCTTQGGAVWSLRATMPFCSRTSTDCTDLLSRTSTFSVLIPTDALRSAVRRTAAAQAEGGQPSAVSLRNVPSPPLQQAHRRPILVSLCAHQNMDAVLVQLGNIAAFVPDSAVVLHLAPSWALTERDRLRLQRANGTIHPLLFVNPTRYRWSFSLLFAIQLQNAVYVHGRFPWLQFTHVLCIASNELFVRRGVEAFVRRYDMSSDAALALQRAHGFEYGGIRTFHGYPMAEMPRRDNFKPDRWSSRSWHGKVPPYGIRGSLSWLTRRVWTLVNTSIALPVEQSFTEGSYFNRSIALQLSDALDEVFPIRVEQAPLHVDAAKCPGGSDATEGDATACFTNWYSWSELVPYTLLQNTCMASTGSPTSGGADTPEPLPTTSSATHRILALRGARCGPRVSSVAWNRPLWRATLRDVTWSRCSPFRSSLFAIKRFSDDMRDPVYRHVQRLAVDLVSNSHNATPPAVLVGSEIRETTDCGRFVPLSLGM